MAGMPEKLPTDKALDVANTCHKQNLPDFFIAEH
jgi:hypothetical protein